MRAAATPVMTECAVWERDPCALNGRPGYRVRDPIDFPEGGAGLPGRGAVLFDW